MRFDPTLADARQAICDLLDEAGITAHNGPPPQIVPPCVLVGPADSYLTPENFGSWRIGHKLVVVAPMGTNERQGDELDATLVEVLTALDTAGYPVGRVTAPGRLDTGHLAVDIETHTDTTIVYPDDPVTHYVTPEV